MVMVVMVMFGLWSATVCMASTHNACSFYLVLFSAVRPDPTGAKIYILSKDAESASHHL